MNILLRVNSNGEIVGSVSFVIEELLALNQTMPTDPNLFALFQSISTPSAGGCGVSGRPGRLGAWLL